MSEEKKENTSLSTSNGKAEDNENLDTLLDSALDDFDKVSETKPSGSTDNSSNNEEVASDDKMWADMLKQALEVDPNMKGIFGQGSADQAKFVQDFSKIAEAAAKVFDGENPTDFTNIMSETLQNLNKSSESIQNQFGNPEELANLFQELGLGSATPGGEEGAIDNMPPFMQTLMQSFLSKDILYPSMKEFVGRYPAWLEENKPKLPADQFDNYSKQLELMKIVVSEYEAESEQDSDDVKNQRFQRIMSHIQEMQTLGQPPIELISDVPLDEAAMPNLPPNMDPSQCSLM